MDSTQGYNEPMDIKSHPRRKYIRTHSGRSYRRRRTVGKDRRRTPPGTRRLWTDTPRKKKCPYLDSNQGPQEGFIAPAR